jgi:diketogulonate reductase-like aldo/keto reductase
VNPNGRHYHSSFGTWKLGKGQDPIDQVDQAISVGFSHIGKPHLETQNLLSNSLGIEPDTAQIYDNEEEAGAAIRESGLSRSDIFITTKYSGVGGLDIPTSIQNSLKKVRKTSDTCTLQNTNRCS